MTNLDRIRFYGCLIVANEWLASGESMLHIGLGIVWLALAGLMLIPDETI